MDQKNTIRITTALKAKYPHLSQKQIKKLLHEQKVIINSSVANKNSRVSKQDKISLSVKNKQELTANPDVACTLIKKTNDYIFFDKGSMIHSVALNYDEENSAANWLLSVDAKLTGISKPLESGLLNRLDYETSGVMVTARTKEAFRHLKNEFQKNKVIKQYACHVSSVPPPKGVYEAFAGQKSRSSKKVIVSESESVKNVPLKKIITEIVATQKIKADCYQVTLHLVTGFRHQIRAHLALLGCPLVGDKLYGGIPSSRLMLHAQKISFYDAKGLRLEASSQFKIHTF